ncbi:MAG: phosphopantetheine-binding protein [Elusimicrobiota bacterium]
MEDFMEELIKELKRRIVENMKLDIRPDEIAPDAPLFGDGLGLDSIDVLELVVMLDRDYGIKIVNMDEGRKAFASVRSIAGYITKNKTAR